VALHFATEAKRSICRSATCPRDDVISAEDSRIRRLWYYSYAFGATRRMLSKFSAPSYGGTMVLVALEPRRCSLRLTCTCRSWRSHCVHAAVGSGAHAWSNRQAGEDNLVGRLDVKLGTSPREADLRSAVNPSVDRDGFGAIQTGVGSTLVARDRDCDTLSATYSNTDFALGKLDSLFFNVTTTASGRPRARRTSRQCRGSRGKIAVSVEPLVTLSSWRLPPTSTAETFGLPVVRIRPRPSLSTPRGSGRGAEPVKVAAQLCAKSTCKRRDRSHSGSQLR